MSEASGAPFFLWCERVDVSHNSQKIEWVVGKHGNYMCDVCENDDGGGNFAICELGNKNSSRTMAAATAAAAEIVVYGSVEDDWIKQQATLESLFFFSKRYARRCEAWMPDLFMKKDLFC